MDLDTTQQILLIILASALAIFLVLSIVIAVMVIRVLKAVRVVAEKAEKLVESAEAVGDIFKRAAGPLGVLRMLHGIVESVTNHKRNNDK
jgi:hypothetical protein